MILITIYKKLFPFGKNFPCILPKKKEETKSFKKRGLPRFWLDRPLIHGMPVALEDSAISSLNVANRRD